jgi:hypothetical protein
MSIPKRVASTGTVTWQVKWRESSRGSRLRSRPFATRRDAQAFQADTDRIARLGAHAPGEASSERLVEWLRIWFESNSHVWALSTSISRPSVFNRWIVPYGRNANEREGCAAGRRSGRALGPVTQGDLQVPVRRQAHAPWPAARSDGQPRELLGLTTRARPKGAT